MNPLLFIAAVIGIMLFTVCVGAMGRNPVFRQIGGSVLWLMLMLIPWLILIRLPYSAFQHLLFSVIFGGLLLLLLLWTWEPFKGEIRRRIIISLITAVCLGIIISILIAL